MKNVFFTVILLASATAYSQARLVLNNDPFVVIDNSAYVVLQNPATNAITQLGTGGRIVSESEFDRVKWMIGTNTGLYTMPYSTSAGLEFPMTMNIATAGAGAGNVTFSTFKGPTWDNNTYRPSDVTHMFDYATGSINNSLNVIDRFWIMDPIGYGTKPSVVFDLTYIDAEWMTVGNTITESDMGAQRFNTGAGLWGDYLPTGVCNTVTNIVSGIPANPANFFRSWTLSEYSNPLPIELVGYDVMCDESMVKINWSTASESNIQKFILSGSTNGTVFIPLKEIPSMSTGGITNYSETVSNDYLYYSLSTVEISGATEIQKVQSINCLGDNSSATAYVSNGNIIADLTLVGADDVNFTIYDAAGQLIKTATVYANENRSSIDLGKLSLATGIYMLKIVSNQNGLVKTIKLYYH